MSAPDDFALALAKLGITEAELNEHNATYSIMEIDLDGLGLRIAPSEIHGNGVFIDRPIMEGCVFMPVIMDGGLTTAGAAVNHSPDANCALVHLPNRSQWLEALRWINAGEELTTDYRYPSWRTYK